MKNKEFLIENGIDVDHGLELLGDMEMYDETLNDFLDESCERLPRLEKSKNECDLANYAIDAHAMKSDSKYLGFTKLAQLSLEHEMAGKEENTDFINQNYNALIEEANRIIKEEYDKENISVPYNIIEVKNG